MNIQTRSEENGIQNFETLQDAMNAARTDETIWKISFQIVDGSRIRLVRENNQWIYENIFTETRNF